MKRLAHCLSLALAFTAAIAGSALAQTNLRIGLAEDPDVLDPSLARTYVGRIVFASICDKLFDIDEKLAIVPQLALGHETSADGTAFTCGNSAQRWQAVAWSPAATSAGRSIRQRSIACGQR